MNEDPEKNLENQEGSVSMTEAETLEFLREAGIAPLKDWKPGQPLLYVFQQRYREDGGVFNSMPRDNRPSIARLDNPTYLDLESTTPNYLDGPLHSLVNEGGRIDYFVIHSKSKRPRLVRTTIGKKDAYLVRGGTLFMAADELFPKGDA